MYLRDYVKIFIGRRLIHIRSKPRNQTGADLCSYFSGQAHFDSAPELTARWIIASDVVPDRNSQFVEYILF